LSAACLGALAPVAPATVAPVKDTVPVASANAVAAGTQILVAV
jgi:hypothetical protein